MFRLYRAADRRLLAFDRSCSVFWWVSAAVKKTPIEQAIAAQTDRRLRYDQKMREAGNRKVTLWVPEPLAEPLREAMKAITNGDGGDIRKEFSEAVLALAACYRIGRPL